MTLERPFNLATTTPSQGLRGRGTAKIETKSLHHNIKQQDLGEPKPKNNKDKKKKTHTHTHTQQQQQ
jgi:hypothetical protein